MTFTYLYWYQKSNLNFQIPSDIVSPFTGFHSLGCWKDTRATALRVLERRHRLLMDVNYKLREDPLRKCAIAALDNKMELFAIENGGQCLGDSEISLSYRKYGKTTTCKGKYSNKT